MGGGETPEKHGWKEGFLSAHIVNTRENNKNELQREMRLRE